MRKWIVRSLVFFCLGAMAAIGLLYQYWTNPSAVRRKVLASLESTFRDVQATVESARLRLFGGIEVKEIRLGRKSDLDGGDFLYIPSATIFHDKEQVLETGLRLRKVEIRRPRIRLVREFDGSWNIATLFGPSDLSRRAPTVVIKQGTLILEDRLAASGTPPLEIRDISLSMVNDPLPIIVFEGTGICEPSGLVKIRGQWVRGAGTLTLTADAPDLTLGPALVQRLAGYNPEAAAHLRTASARGKLSARVAWDPRTRPALRYSLSGQISSGQLSHALLPWPLEQLRGTFHCTDGVVPVARFEASSGGASASLELRNVQLAGPAPASQLDRIGSLELEVRNFPVDAGLFAYLPAGLRSYQQEYSPSGTASACLKLKRIGSGLWLQNGTVTAVALKGVYTHFRYPVQDVRGSVSWHMTTNLAAGASWNGRPDDWVSVDLKGVAGGKPVFIKGRMEGERGVSSIQLDVWGNDFPLDERLLATLPPRPQHAARNFQPAGKLDFRVFVRRPRGQGEISKRFLLYLHDCTACYTVFPLPLSGVSGTLDVRADSWEFRDFIGKHNGGVIRASGHSSPMKGGVAAHSWSTAPEPIRKVSHHAGEESEPQASPTRVSVEINGENLAIDEAFKKALAPGREGLVKAFNAFNLAGRLNFTARIDDLPNQPRDIDVTVRIGGCRINPAFFPYPLEEVAATVRYAKKNVWVTGFQGRHGTADFRVGNASVVLPDDGGFWVRLDRLEAAGLQLDGSLQQALPAPLAKLVKTLQVSRPIGLSAVLVIKQSPVENSKPQVYWDALTRLTNTSLQVGAELTGVNGVISCVGLHNGQQIEDIAGNVFLDSANVLNQPLRNVRVPLVIRKEWPDVLSLPDLTADLFGGTVGGEARVEFGTVFRYELALNASRVQLEQVGNHNFGRSAELSGLANAGIHIAGQGTDLDGLKGHGRIDIPNGRLYRLPALLALVKWLGLRVPDRTGFEQARVEFRIEGPRMHISELDLYGSAISVRGSGSMNLNGSDVNLNLNADWARLTQILPPIIDDLSRGLSNQLLRVKVHGKVGELKFEKELVPAVTDPLKRLWKGLAATPAKQGNKETRRQGDRETGRQGERN